MTTETERAWAAGFFDGEGCTSLATAPTRRTKTYLRMQISQAGTDDHEIWRGGGGLCSMHHQRIKKHGDPNTTLRKRARLTSPVEVR